MNQDVSYIGEIENKKEYLFTVLETGMYRLETAEQNDFEYEIYKIILEDNGIGYQGLGSNTNLSSGYYMLDKDEIYFIVITRLDGNSKESMGFVKGQSFNINEIYEVNVEGAKQLLFEYEVIADVPYQFSIDSQYIYQIELRNISGNIVTAINTFIFIPHQSGTLYVFIQKDGYAFDAISTLFTDEQQTEVEVKLSKDKHSAFYLLKPGTYIVTEIDNNNEYEQVITKEEPYMYVTYEFVEFPNNDDQSSELITFYLVRRIEDN